MVSLDENYWSEPNPPSVVQLNSAGQFTSISGLLMRDEDLPIYFARKVDSTGKPSPAYLRVDLSNENEVSLATLLAGVNRLRRAAPPHTEGVIFVRFRGLLSPGQLKSKFSD